MNHLILGIETSCDETAAAVLEGGSIIRSNIVASQATLHAPYGGIVPELASRRHLENILPIVTQALDHAHVRLQDLEAIAVTTGPGLVGSLLVGVSIAKSLAYILGIPLIAVNHLEGHIHAIFLENPDLEYPFTSLVVSGGHTHLYHVEGEGRYLALARARDDAAGEAFDKVAKLLGLGYPGGPFIEKAASKGNPRAISFPRSFLGNGSLDFSFSGLKTAVLYYLGGLGYRVHGSGFGSRDSKEEGFLDPQLVADIAASFQQAVIEVLTRNTIKGARAKKAKRIVLTGGVACNQALRSYLRTRAQEEGLEVLFPSPPLCTDNGAMIARAGYRRLLKGERAGLDLNASANLPLC